jgi:D-sedoheptulose 7-phosphate isomerase
VARVLSRIDLGFVEKVSQCFLDARRKNKTIYFAGNGGSAATASHFAQDIGELGRKIRGRGFKAFSINDNSPALTAISNDYDYSQIFSMQLAEHFDPGDVLVVISASGNSPNVVKAAVLAKKKRGVVVGLVGFDGGRLAQICDIVVHVPSNKGEYGPVEDAHLVIEHMITSYLMIKMCHVKEIDA